MFKIMIVEDDQTISGLIADNLKKWQFDPVVITDFNAVFDDFLQEKPHLVLLDINLPVFDGYYWCQKIRETSKVPIIFISSRNTNMDMIMAMNMGADDFVTKPFEIDVLIAKINALLRRSYNYVENNSETLVHNGLTLNIDNSSMQINDEVIDLGKDVPIEEVVNHSKKNNIQLVGLSALMTTTVHSMKETIDAVSYTHLTLPTIA